MVDLTDITKHYDKVRAVEGVSLSLAPGVVTGLLGPNGAGKSTLIRIIAGLLSPTAGSARVCGFDTLASAAQARAQLGYLPEFAPLYTEMTPIEYLWYRARLMGLARAARRSAIERAIEQCDLGELRNRPIAALSKGYRQRVGLASAILHDPRVLVLDEPTTGLDPTQIRHSRELFRRLAQGRVVLLSSHILPEIEATCDRIVILARGRVRADGTPRQLVASLAGTDAQASACIVEPLGTEAGQQAKLQAALEALPFVASVQPTCDPAGRAVLAVRARPGPLMNELDELGELAKAAGAAGVPLRQLFRPAPTLEQVFVRVVTGVEAAA
jgi:ABC-2 type transport system ATP-binding protein